MRKTVATLGLIGLLTLSFTLTSRADVPEKPSISTSQKMKLTALVEAIDLEKREVTLRGPQGNRRTIQLGDTAPRLEEVEVGDTVLAEYVQDLTLKVVPANGMKPGGGVMSAVSRGPADEAPSVVVTDTSISTATVVGIDLENNTFKLDWGDGRIEEYVARNPENLRRADVGDLVVVTYTAALALAIQEIPAD